MININIEGLDNLEKQLSAAQKAMQELDGELAQVKFDPNDPGSIEAAIQEAHTAVDQKVGSYATNPFIAPLIEQMKESFREEIINRAAMARLAGDSE